MANEIVDLSKNGSIGVSSNKAYASLGYGYELSADFCHGVNLSLGGSVYAEAGLSQHIADFFEAVVEIEAGVEAGIQFAAQLSPDALDDLGLLAAVKAYLKAYIRVRLELLLKLDKVTSGVKQNSSSLQYKIFEAFVEQIEIGIGVEANVQLALTAAAEVACRARLVEEEGTANEPGFDFRVNAEAAFLFGAGFDFFTMARFKDISGFFKIAKNIILTDIRSLVATKELLDDEQAEFVFKIWSAALDMIIDASVAEITEKRASFLDTIRSFTLEFLFQNILDAYVAFLETQSDKIAVWLEQHFDDFADDANAILLRVNNLQANIEAINEPIDIIDVLNDFIALADELGYDHIDEVQEIGTHLHVFGYLIDEANKPFWRELPPYARERYLEATGNNIRVLNTRARAYNYLSSSCFKSFLESDVIAPDSTITEFMDLLNQNGANIGVFIETLLDKKDEAAKTQILETGINLIQKLFDKHVVDAINDTIRPEVSGNVVNSYQAMVIEDLLNSFSTIFMPMLKVVFVDRGTKKDIENLTYMANRFLLGLLARNISFMTNYLMNYATENISDSINEVRRKVRGGSLNRIADNLFDRVIDQVDDIVPYDLPDNIQSDTLNALVEATNDFVLDILDIADDSMGRQTWTENRIHTLTNGIEYMLFNPDSNALDFRLLDVDDITTQIEGLRKCSFLPQGSLGQLQDVTRVLQAVGLIQIKAYLLKMPLALAIYFLKILKILFIDLLLEILELLFELFKEIYSVLLAFIEDVLEALEDLAGKLVDALEELGEAIAEAFIALVGAIDDFFDALLGDLDFSDLDWLDDLIDFFEGIFGGDSEEEDAKKAVNELRRQALENLDRQQFMGAMSNLTKRDDFSDQTLYHWVDNFVLTSSITDKLNQMEFHTSNAVSTKWNANKPDQAARDLKMKSLRYTSFEAQKRDKERNLDSMNRRREGFEFQLRQLDVLDPDKVVVNSPLPLDVRQDDIPIYGKYVYLDIDFGPLDLRAALRDQFEIYGDELVDINDELSTWALRSKVRRIPDRQNTSLLQIKILLNGEEIETETAEVTRSKLRGHIPSSMLKQGTNDLFVLVITPPGHEHKAVTRHIRFFCDQSRKKRPSNAVYIDLKKTVINSMGDDHLDAARESTEDKEKVVISNNSDEEVDLEGWKLSDAAGHEYEFVKYHRIKPGDTTEVLIGKTPSTMDSWEETYKGRLIAVLNNRGEFLKLENPDGKIISHVYTGSPSSNKHIKFLRAK